MTHAAPDNENVVPKSESASAAENGGSPGAYPADGGSRSFASDLARSASGNPNEAAGIARLASTGFLKAMSSFAKGSLEQAASAAKQISDGAPVTQVIDSQIDSVRHSAASFIGLTDSTGRRIIKGLSAKELRARGMSMIDQSWDAALQAKGEHPAYGKILEEITHDEARIIRFMAAAGPQPVVDVRSKTLMMRGSELLAQNITMICYMAGCLYPDKDEHYFGNLTRLGLLEFNDDPVTDFRRYSFIESQPRVNAAMEKANKAITILRSAQLTLFGQQLAELCFDLEGYDGGGWKNNDRGDHIIGKGIPPLKKKHH